MTVVNSKSISGITSITSPSGGDNLLTIHTSDTTERLRVQSDKVMFSLDAKVDGDNTRDLGASGATWKNLYLGTQATVGTGVTINKDGNIYATGIVTATTFSGTATGLDSSGDATVGGDLYISEKIIHTGDTNTQIRFPTADTITLETSGTETLRVDSSQRLLIGHNAATTNSDGENPFLQVKHKIVEVVQVL